MFSTELNRVQADLARATQATEGLLRELLTDSYVFEVEPRDGSWQVKVEFATREGAWQTLNIATGADLLLASLDDEDSHRLLLTQWGERIHGGER